MKDTAPHNKEEKISLLQIKTKIALQNILEKHHPEFKLENAISMISDELDEGDITIESLAEEWFIYLFKKGHNSFSIPFRHACIYLEKSRRAINSGNLEEAFESAIKAAERTITAASHTANQSLDEPSLETRKRRARLGGLKINEKYIPAKEEAARLLREKMPTDGWNSASHAANEIADELYSFIQRNDIPLMHENLPETIKRWIRKNSLPNIVFNKSKPSKQKHTPQ